MRRLLLPAAMAPVLAFSGCGDDAPERDLRSDKLVVVDWKRAAPRALCQSETEARAATSRIAVRTRDHPSGRECWIAVVGSRPVATGADVRAVSRVDDQEELRFSPEVGRRLVALGTDTHVGVIYDGRLLDVVFPLDGNVRIPPAGAEAAG
ncbi:hypothetical protein GKE82_25225 [Conexibacter sp. W3-3-2]|uniref:hypothetical protein n=1 Tax=Conexibacter sp. W3-3-2 TaxID=2675227 RepID=UPI0012B7E982|nr:hypothetical protein [Conexibacter sp. W3-3-2]MTD47509.1 hypothetical protein [Conexibacter sp. W3-3-2]